MKILSLVFLLNTTFNCFAQEGKTEFAIYFGNDFTKDSVTILINGILVAKNIKLRATMISPQNLIITQDRHNMTVQPYYEPMQTLKKLPLKNSILNLKILINNVWRNFSFNLKEGKFLFPGYNFLEVGKSDVRVLTITQRKRGPLLL